MSIHAINAALEAECGSPVKKIVLLVLANYANEKNSCFPSKRRISRMGNISEASVKRAIKELREMGFIEIRERYQSSARTPLWFKVILGVGLRAPRQ